MVKIGPNWRAEFRHRGGGGGPLTRSIPAAGVPCSWVRRVFTSGGGRGSIEPPKTGGGGFGKRAQLTGTINQSLGTLAPKAPNFFLSIKIGQICFNQIYGKW